MENFNLKKFLVENKLTTNSKTLKEEEENGAWKSFTTPSSENFMADVNQEISNWNWVANIAKEAVQARSVLTKVLARLGYGSDYNPDDMGFEIREADSEKGPFKYRGAIFCDVNAARQSNADYKKIQSDPEFQKYFESIGPVTWVSQPTNKKYATMILMKQGQLPQ